jgi:hypothetical protein
LRTLLRECFCSFCSDANCPRAPWWFLFSSYCANIIPVKFLKLILPLICCHALHAFNHAIISSVFLLRGRWLVFGRLLRLVHLLVLLISAPLVMFLFYQRRFKTFSMISCWGMSMIAICCRIFSLVSDVGIAPRLLWLGLTRKVTVLVLLDFLKDFDLINHELFDHKLGSRYDFRTSAMGMVSSFLHNRSKVVKDDDVKSKPCSLSSGVPQG